MHRIQILWWTCKEDCQSFSSPPQMWRQFRLVESPPRGRMNQSQWVYVLSLMVWFTCEKGGVIAGFVLEHLLEQLWSQHPRFSFTSWFLLGLLHVGKRESGKSDGKLMAKNRLCVDIKQPQPIQLHLFFNFSYGISELVTTVCTQPLCV